MGVAIVDYQSGNLHSASKAFERAAKESALTVSIEVTGDPERIRKADRVVLPGVGAFGDCYRGLASTPGLMEALQEAVIEKGKPFFGICVGMQLMADRGLEHGVHRGLGWIAGEVGPLDTGDPSLKIPHMGWNTLSFSGAHPLIAGIPGGADGWHAYFVHSYCLYPERPDSVVAGATYGRSIAALVVRDNMAGSQFHPEKSQKLGLKLITNFLRWRP